MDQIEGCIKNVMKNKDGSIPWDLHPEIYNLGLCKQIHNTVTLKALCVLVGVLQKQSSSDPSWWYPSKIKYICYRLFWAQCSKQNGLDTAFLQVPHLKRISEPFWALVGQTIWASYVLKKARKQQNRVFHSRFFSQLKESQNC